MEKNRLHRHLIGGYLRRECNLKEILVFFARNRFGNPIKI